MGECWLSMGHYMAAGWAQQQMFRLSLPALCAAIFLSTVFCVMGTGKGRGKKDTEHGCLTCGEEVCSLS